MLHAAALLLTLPLPQWSALAPLFQNELALPTYLSEIQDAPAGWSTSKSGGKIYRYENGQIEWTQPPQPFKFIFRPQGNTEIQASNRTLIKWWRSDSAITWSPHPESLIQWNPASATQGPAEILYRDDRKALMIRILNPADLALAPLPTFPPATPYLGYADPAWKKFLEIYAQNPAVTALFSRAAADLGWKTGGVAIYLFADRPTYLKYAGSAASSLGTAGEYGFTAAYQTPSSNHLTPGSPDHHQVLTETLLHETTHQLALSHCARQAGLPVGDLEIYDEPLWFTEGLAQLLPALVSSDVARHQTDQSKAYWGRKTKPKVLDLQTGKSEDLYIAGPQMVRILIQMKGLKAFRKFYDRYCQRGNFEAELTRVYGVSTASLFDRTASKAR